MARIRLGDLLVKAGLIDELQLQSALAHQRQWGGKLGDVLVNNGFLDEMMLWRGLSKQLGVPLVSLPELQIPAGMERQIPLELALKNSIFPIARDDKAMTVATSDPGNIGGLDEISFRLGVRIKTVLAPDREIEWAIRRFLQGDPAPCPPPRLRRQMDAPPQAEHQAAPAMEIERGPHVAQVTLGSVSTSATDLAAFAAAAAAAAGVTLPAVATSAPPAQAVPYTQMPTQPWTPSPTATHAFSQPPQQPTPWAPSTTQTWAPSTTQTWTQPPAQLAGQQAQQAQQAAPSEAELMVRETAQLLRFVIEGCITRGIFTREEFLQKLRQV